ncbi:MAG: cellobiose phosphorylase [Chloroflexota bacterium]
MSSTAPSPAVVTLAGGDGLSIELLANGAIRAIRHGDILVNQVLGSPLDGGLGNLYVRRHDADSVAWFPVLGPGSAGRFRAAANGAAWDGSVDGLTYVCTLRLAPDEATWFWTLQLGNETSETVTLDVVAAQDLGLAVEATVRTSERYTSQYLDHTILDDPTQGFLVCSRQGLPQDGRYPWLAQGCLDGAVGFLTDGSQLYGLDAKATGRPTALSRPMLPNARRQGEFALSALQSRPMTLEPGERRTVTCFAAVLADHPAATSAADVAVAHAARATFDGLDRSAIGGGPLPRSAGLFDAPARFRSRDLDEATLARLVAPPSTWRHIERRDDTLLSFFHGRQEHVVLRAKELAQERASGHILRSGRALLPSDDTLSCTTWVYGVFGSQLAIGNTSFNLLLSVCRDPLGIGATSGQRIFLRTERGDELLALPSAFEMGSMHARWIYDDEERTIVVRLTAALDQPTCRLDVVVERGGPVQLVITEDIVLGADDGNAPGTVTMNRNAGLVTLRPAVDGTFARHYPDATFWISTPDPGLVDAIGRDELLFADGAARGSGHVVIVTKPTDRFSICLGGSLSGAAPEPAFEVDEARERSAAAFWSGLAQGASLGGGHHERTALDLARIADLMPWYVHDGLIHASTPHGLEQYTGAAWAVRDVCQGPVELFLATGNHAAIRDILRVVYEHQFRQTGDWPQWFMVDRYGEVQAADSHADIRYWPLKALCDYIEATDDLAILDEPIPWTDRDTLAVSDDADSVLVHTERQIDLIEADCIPGTALPVFGGGDWDDSLQPVDPSMARQLVSSWTVALAYQTLQRYRAVCERGGRAALAARLGDLTRRIAADFRRYLVPDGVVAGLANFGEDGIEYLLHPRDDRTGVNYRLIPMTRGIISDLFSAEQAANHVALIERHLTFPDGVRLMDRPMPYRGGTSTIFRRAESAAFFGREIGLQYVHAHIRYIEAMCRLGRADAAFDALLTICPILLERDVPNALPRQANAYFSSSDADVPDREAATRDFELIRSGEIGVKGGWRVYSSGPGIYLRQLIANVLGLRLAFDDVVFDPVLPARADGLTFERDEDGRRVRYLFHVSGGAGSAREVRVNGVALPDGRRTRNPYRVGGLLVNRTAWAAALDRPDNLVEVFA